MNAITLSLTVVLVAVGVVAGLGGYTSLAFALFALAVIVSASLKMANNWEKFVILRAGRFQSAKGPGLFFIIPILDAVTAVIGERIQTTAFAAEQALTKDTVPVNVDAIIFWHVHDARKAALEITDSRQAIDRGAQPCLRE